LAAAPASASLINQTVDFYTGQTGSTTINPTGGPFPVTVIDPGAEAGACIGPNTDNCVTSGMSMVVDIGSDNIGVLFFGSTTPAGPGGFSFLLDGFSDTILNVTPLLGSLTDGTFGLAAVGPHSVAFSGSTVDSFNAGSGSVFVFSLSTADRVPEPGTIGLTLTALGALTWTHGRKRGKPRPA
jgi:hypothetical protein